MNKSPAFQFYPRDFLADERVVLMSNQALGCYVKLLCYCWLEGSIPSDVSKLARLCGEDGSAMSELWRELEVCFRTAANLPDRFIHERLDAEREKQALHRLERSESGRKGAQARWNRDSHSVKSQKESAKAQPSDSQSPAIKQPVVNNDFASSSAFAFSDKNPQKPPAANQNLPTTDEAKRVAAIYRRRLTTPWSEREVKAFKKAGITDEDLDIVEPYYAANWPPNRDKNILRHDLATFLNNFRGEVDRARTWISKNPPKKSAPDLNREISQDVWDRWWKEKYPNLSELHHSPKSAGARFIKEFWEDLDSTKEAA